MQLSELLALLLLPLFALFLLLPRFLLPLTILLLAFFPLLLRLFLGHREQILVIHFNVLILLLSVFVQLFNLDLIVSLWTLLDDPLQ